MSLNINLKVAIIGGSGFYNMPELCDIKYVKVDTEFGSPSDEMATGSIDGVSCVVLARHGRDHRLNPTEVNYRANIRALQKLGVTHILASNACGSLKEDHYPGQFLILDSFIDRTTKRAQTFHDATERNSSFFGTVCHIQMHPSFCPETTKFLRQSASELAMEKDVKPQGTIVVVEGPRFSSRAESLLFRSWGADVVGMTTVPEVVLAKEAGISYAAIAMVTDYDCWKDEEVVNAQSVLTVMKDNVENVRKLLVKTIQLMKNEKWNDVIQANKDLAKRSVIH